MAVYYKFKSAKDFDSVAIDGNFISVGHLKEKIFELKHLGRGTDFDLVVTNAQTNEEYLDEGTLIPKNTSVLIRRVPGRPRNPIITAPVAEQEEANVVNFSDGLQTVQINFGGAAQSSMKYAEDLEWDEFGNDLYAIPETVPVQLNNTVQNPSPPVSKEDEDSKIKALIDTPALDWQRQPADGFGPGRGFGRGMGGRMMGGRGFGRGGMEKKIPPQGYICHRCKVPGHFIQHCPTNGDPNYDIKKVKPPTGIPKSMLMATPDGSYSLPSGAVAVLKPNEAAFEKQIEGMPSLRTAGDFPPELHCPLCKEVMKDAVLTSKCCFKTFCDKCIRDHIILKSSCICGATNILADHLLPNYTVRDSINRILESNNSSAEDGAIAYQIQDMESRNPQAKVPSPTQSAASKGEQVLAPQPQKEESSKILNLVVEEDKAVNAPPATQMQEKGKSPKVPDVSEATHDSKSVKETPLPAHAQLADEEVQQKLVLAEAGKKKKKKKIPMPSSAAEMQWRMGQDLVPDNYMMPLGPSGFNPYWNGIQPGFDGFVPPYGAPMPYMGYGFGPPDMAFGGVFPHDPFGGGPGCMLPYAPPQRDLAELAMGFNAGPPPPAMSREEFEARKANLKRKREIERHRDMDLSKDREYGREVSSSVDLPKMRSKSNSIPPASSPDRPSHRHRSERLSPDHKSRNPDVPLPSSRRKPEEHRSQDYHDDDNQRHRDHHHRSSSRRTSESPPVARPQPSLTDNLHKASVFSRISFPAEDTTAPKKRKVSSSSESPATGPTNHRKPAFSSNGYHEEHNKTVSGSRKSNQKSSHAIAGYREEHHDSSDEERHFKRRPSRYTSSSPPADVVEVEEHRHSKGSRDRNRDRDQGVGYNKRR